MPNPKMLFLYCDQEVVRSFYARNRIAPNAELRPPIPGAHPLGTQNPAFLFVTHLPVASSERGIGDLLATGQRFPVTLAFDFPKKETANRPVVLLAKGTDGELATARGTWAEYDTKKHVGAFLFGDIPLSAVRSIRFESETDRSRLAAPSPDLWFPEELFAIAPTPPETKSPFDGLTELPPVSEELKAEQNAAMVAARLAEKRRAAALMLVHGSTDWQIGDLTTGFDAASQRLFGLSDDVVGKAIPGWADLVRGNPADILPWDPVPDESSAPDLALYRKAFDVFAGIPFRAVGVPAQTTESMCGILKRLAEVVPEKAKFLTGVVAHLESPASGMPLPQLLLALPPEEATVRALLMLARAPNDVEELEKGLTVYKLSQDAARKALVLWGALNGLRGVPGMGFGKSNRPLWAFLENRLAVESEAPLSFVPAPTPKAAPKNKRILDAVTLRKEEIVRGETVYAFFRDFVGSGKKVPPAVEKELLAGWGELFGSESFSRFRSMVPAKLKAAVVAKLATNPVSPNEWEACIRDIDELGHKAFVPDVSAMARDLFESADRFARFWNHDRAFWITEYKKARPKPKATKKAPEKETNAVQKEEPPHADA